MGTLDMLNRSIAYEESLLRTYRQYAAQAADTEIGALFNRLIEEKCARIEELKAMHKRYCKP